MNNVVFTLTGLSGAGKDVVADMIKEEFNKVGKTTFKLAYADYLKSVAARNFNYDYNSKEKDRNILQNFGTIVRETEKDFWVHIVWQTIDAFRSLANVFVISDARYENELEPKPYNLSYPVFNVYIIGNPERSHIGIQEANHESESLAREPNYNKFHFTIDNSGTLEETRGQVVEMIKIVNDMWEQRLKEQREYKKQDFGLWSDIDEV